MIKIDQSICIGCGACSTVCPVTALLLNEDGVCECDNNECIECLSCLYSCPVDAISSVSEDSQMSKSEKKEKIYHEFSKMEFSEFVKAINYVINRWCEDNDIENSEVKKELK